MTSEAPVTSAVRSHRTTATDPYARGRELGVACAAGVRRTLACYRELWAAFSVTPEEVHAVGESVLGSVEAFAPTLRAEIAGIAAGAGLAESEVGALNARSELLALGERRLAAAGLLPGEPVTECSTLVRLPRDAAPLSAQTWDWHTTLQDSWFVWTLALPAGRTVRTLTEYGIAGKIGVATDTGLDGTRHGAVGVNFNALRHVDDTGTGGVPVHVVARRVLDEAHTIDDAVAIAGQAEVTASAAVTVTARDRASGSWTACTLELHPGGPSLQPQSAGDGGCWLAHTNHFLAADVPPEANVSSDVSTTGERLDRVEPLAHAGVPGAPHPQQVAEQLAMHDLGPRDVCVHGNPLAPVGQRSATLAVAVAEPSTGRLHVHAGRACEARSQTWWSG